MSTANVCPCEEITAMLDAWNAGDEGALGALIPVVFDDLRRMARHYFSREAPESTLEPTAVVHEVYLRLVDQPLSRFANRDHFFAIASRLIRQVLVDHARSRNSRKRGGDCPKVPLAEAFGVHGRSSSPETLISIHTALESLGRMDERKTRLVELRFFCGLTLPEAAEVLGISRASAERDWTIAKRWLAQELSEDSPSRPEPRRNLEGVPRPRGRASRSDRPAD